jgi:predicted regulator of Ras-like GTPase activity (Roadblock/LC7/MglB family)
LGEGHAAILAVLVAGPALTPPLALEYLDELSTDIRAAVVLDAGGKLAASSLEGERADQMRALTLELLDQARDAWDGEGDVSQVEVGTTAGAVFAVRGESWTIAVLSGRYALSSLMFYDLRSVVADLGAPA